jgi:hypothetical protein
MTNCSVRGSRRALSADGNRSAAEGIPLSADGATWDNIEGVR